MSYNTKNYAEQGGDKLVIGGELEIREDAVVTGLPMIENQPNSAAEDVEGLVADFNALLEKLKAAGIMAAE